MHVPASSDSLRADRPLAGASCWIISEAKAGMDAQTEGLAQALGLNYLWKRVANTGLKKWTAPWGRVPGRIRFGAPDSEFAPPWPQVAIATGRAAIPYVRELKRRAGAGVFTVVLLDPQVNNSVADLIWVPAHDRRRGSNVVTSLTSPHRFSPQRLAELRQSLPSEIAALPAPRIAVLLGGKNGVYAFSADDDRRFARGLKSLADLGASFLITTSRRTHRQLRDVAEEATRNAPRIFWDGGDNNPYPQFLAHADAFLVTADSINMTGECCATGRPVLVFTPSGGKAKFGRFHHALQEAGATRAMPDHLDALPDWTYEPIDSTPTIAAEIERRWRNRQTWLKASGATGPS